MKWRKFFRETSAAVFYAAVQATPSEVIKSPADANAANMGLITFPKERVRQADVTVGKNYLGSTELDDLNRFSTLLLNFILDQAKQGRMVTMEQSKQRIVEVTELSGRKVLRSGGRVLRGDADTHAMVQYKIYDAKLKVSRQTRGDSLFDDSERDT